MSILVCSLCKNEMGRYLTDVVPIWQDFADEILVIDDGSDDGSYEYLEDMDCRVYRNMGQPMFGHEADIRNELWHCATQSKHDWLFWIDTDVYITNDPTYYFGRAEEEGVNSLFFRYIDLWGDGVYREDEWWSAHLRGWCWAIRNFGPNTLSVQKRGWHSGHIPVMAKLQPYGQMPEKCSLLHLAYATEEGRQRQYEKYLGLWKEGHITPAEWDHAQTIIDPNPNLLPLNMEQQYYVAP